MNSKSFRLYLSSQIDILEVFEDKIFSFEMESAGIYKKKKNWLFTNVVTHKSYFKKKRNKNKIVF